VTEVGGKPCQKSLSKQIYKDKDVIEPRPEKLLILHFSHIRQFLDFP